MQEKEKKFESMNVSCHEYLKDDDELCDILYRSNPVVKQTSPNIFKMDVIKQTLMDFESKRLSLIRTSRNSSFKEEV